MSRWLPSSFSGVAMSADATDALSRLRLLVQYEFTSELSNHELLQALRLCNRDVKAAYELLKQKRASATNGLLQSPTTATVVSASSPQSTTSAAMPSDSSKRKSANDPFGSATKRRRDNALALRPVPLTPPSTHSPCNASASSAPNSTAKSSTSKSKSTARRQSSVTYRDIVDPALATRLCGRFDQVVQNVDNKDDDSDDDDEGFELLQDQTLCSQNQNPNREQQSIQRQQENNKPPRQSRDNNNNNNNKSSHRDQPLAQALQEPEDEEDDDQSSAVGSQVDPSLARQVLETSLDEMCDHRMMSQVDWISQMFALLEVTDSMECAKQLDQVVECLAQSLRLVTKQDGQEWKQSQMDLIIRIAAMLPNANRQNQVIKRLVPTDEELEERDAAVRNLQQCGAVDKTPRRYSRNAIDCITIACSLYIERMKCFGSAWETVTMHQEDCMRHFDATHATLTKQLAQSQEQVKLSDEKLAEAKRIKDENGCQIHVFVEQIKRELMANGEAEESAAFEAYMQVLESREDAVVTLLNARRDIANQTDTLTANHQRALKKLKYYELLMEFLRVVKEKRQSSLTEAARLFRQRRAASDERVVQQLKEFIPKLMNALLEFNSFHSLQQQKATEELELQRIALDTHKEFFGDAAPSKQEDIEKRIREFMGIITQSTSVMVQIVETQKTTWLGASTVLPSELLQFLAHHFETMWKQLKGPMKEKFKSVFEEIAKTTMDHQMDGSVGVMMESDSSSGDNTKDTIVNKNPPTLTGPNPNRTKAGSNKSVMYSTVEHQPIKSTTGRQQPTEMNSLVRFEIDPKTTQITEVDMQPHQPSYHTPEKFAHPIPSPSPMASPSQAGDDDGNLLSSPLPKHLFKIADVLYTKFNLGGNRTEFFRGKVVELLDDGRYTMAYDDGDMFTMEQSFLFTEEQMEEDLRLQQHHATPPESPQEPQQHQSGQQNKKQNQKQQVQSQRDKPKTGGVAKPDDGSTCAIM